MCAAMECWPVHRQYEERPSISSYKAKFKRSYDAEVLNMWRLSLTSEPLCGAPATNSIIDSLLFILDTYPSATLSKSARRASRAPSRTSSSPLGLKSFMVKATTSSSFISNSADSSVNILNLVSASSCREHRRMQYEYVL